jgi:hypothetical protein
MASAFEKAFASARKAGKKVFSYNGKSYNTKLASDTPKKGPVPKSRQGQDSGSGGRATKAAPAKKQGASPAESKKVMDAVNKKHAKPMQGPKKSNAGASYP